MEYKHVSTIQDGIEEGDMYKMFVFEQTEYERTPFGPEVSIHAHDYEGYYDDEGTHYCRFLWVESRGNGINVAITDEHYVPCTEDHPQWDGARAEDGTPGRMIETTAMEENVGDIEEVELLAVIERLINNLE